MIISTGDEIVIGQLLDTNSKYLAERLVDRGIMPVEHVSVPDDAAALAAALRRACAAAPLVIMSGGLGPTDGDLTREALAAVLGEELVLDANARSALAAMLAARGRELTSRQERQAFRPVSAACLLNSVGTAPGLHAVVRVESANGTTDVFCLPGPPGELRPMFEAEVVPRLRARRDRTILTRLLQIVGIAEADCVSRLGDLTRRERMPLVGVTASGGILTIRIRYEGDSGADGRKGMGEALMDEAESCVREALGDHVFASGPATGTDLLARTIIESLAAQQRTLSVVESCTGGMLGQMLTSVPGSSSAFLGGAITYANALKVGLGVRQSTLDIHGAVSADTCREMVLAGLGSFASDYALAITGVAGPDGGSAEKPVGTVYIGAARRDVDVKVGSSAGQGATAVDVRRFLFAGDRDDICRRASVSAMAMLYFALRGHAPGAPGLLWESKGA